MIQGLAKNLAFSASRRVCAVLLVTLLNLVLVPCAMALEVAEEGHDCCPPELNVEVTECCELDGASGDTRDLRPRDLPDDTSLATGSFQQLVALVPGRSPTSTDPPDPPDLGLVVHKLFCVYLN